MGLGGSNPKSQNINLLTPGQSWLFTGLEGLLASQLGVQLPADATTGMAAYQNKAVGVSPYPGELVPGPTDLQTQLFNVAGGTVGNLFPQTSQTLGGILQPWNEGQATQWFNQAVTGPSMNNFTQNIMPQVMESFAGYDAANSGGARRALSEAGTGLQTNLAANLANWLNTSKQQTIANQLSASGLSSDFLSKGLQAGLQQYGIKSAQDEASYKEWLRTQPYNNPWLQYLMPMIQQRTYEPMITPGQQSGFGDFFTGILGTAGKIMGGLGAMGVTF